MATSFILTKEIYIKLSIAKQFTHEFNMYTTFAGNEPLKTDKIRLKNNSDFT